jgi:hypothetical protein
MPVIKNRLFYEDEKSYLFIKAKSINTTDPHCLGWQQQLLLQRVDANKNSS